MKLRIHLPVLAALALTLAWAWPAHASALRCGTQLVKPGDSSYRVSRYCPEPFWTDAWEIPGRFAYDVFNGSPVDRWEAWYVNLGSRKLMRRLVFRNGYLERIDELGYGYSGGPGRCNAFQVESAGATLAEVYAECGPPDYSQSWPVTVRSGYQHGYGVPSLVFHETWVYEFGPRAQVRILEFQDGQLIRLRREAP